MLINNEIKKLSETIVNSLSPERIYLFGSFAKGTANDKSDYDFYVLLDDKAKDLHAKTVKAYEATMNSKSRPLDIVVSRIGKFESRKNDLTFENEVARTGVLLYDRNS